MKRHCLFIDDDIEEFESVIQRLPGIAKASWGLDVSYDILNPMDKKYRNETNDIDLAKIEEDFHGRISNYKYDLIACDFDLGDTKVFGTDLIKKYRQKDQKFIAVIYSADLTLIVRRIVEEYKSDNVDATLQRITGLVTSKISRFFSKNNHLMDDLSPMLYRITAEKHVEHILTSYKALIVSHGFSSLVGVSFEEIANHVREDTDQGKRFIEEVIERGISHMVKLNGE